MGNITVTTQGDAVINAKDATVNTTANATIAAQGSATVSAGTVATVTAPAVLLGSASVGNKRVVVDGDPTAKGDTVIALQNHHVYAL